MTANCDVYKCFTNFVKSSHIKNTPTLDYHKSYSAFFFRGGGGVLGYIKNWLMTVRCIVTLVIYYEYLEMQL